MIFSGKSLIQKYIAFAFLYFGWGSLYFAISVAVKTMPPFLLAGSSSIIAALILMAVSRSPRPSFLEWKASLMPALFLIMLGNGAIVWAEQTIPSAITAIILSTEPAWMVFLDRIFFKGPKISRFQIAGIALGILGVTLLVGGSNQWKPAGAVAAFIAAFGWSLGSLMCRSKDLPKNPAMAIALPVLLGGIGLMGLSFLSGELSHFQLGQVHAASLYAYVYIVLICYVATYLSYIWLLKNVRISQVSTYAYVNPLMAVLLGVFVAGEKLGRESFLGGAVVMAAVFLILKNNKKETLI